MNYCGLTGINIYKTMSQYSANGRSPAELHFIPTHNIIETYSSGTSWYRVYSDGWCEQGGRTGSVADYASTTVSFLKSFANANYTLKVTGLWQGTNDDGSWMQAFKIQQNLFLKTGFTVYSRSGTPKTFTWMACGYIS